MFILYTDVQSHSKWSCSTSRLCTHVNDHSKHVARLTSDHNCANCSGHHFDIKIHVQIKTNNNKKIPSTNNVWHAESWYNYEVNLLTVCTALMTAGKCDIICTRKFFFSFFCFHFKEKKKKSLLYLNKIPFNQFSQKYKIKVKLKSKHISKTKELVIQNLLQLQTCSTVNNRYLEKKAVFTAYMMYWYCPWKNSAIWSAPDNVDAC